jgi:hypothetical protein
MYIMTNTKSTPKFIKLLLKEGGATSEELRVAMNRVWGPTNYQLLPIAKREGYSLRRFKVAGEPKRYQFVARKPRAKKAKIALVA